jgi:hypothetical protein
LAIRSLRLALGGWLAGTLVVICGARADDQEFRVYTDHPRLILTQQRLKLLKRERERESMRWRQFDLLVKGGASLPEPGFALALYYAVSGDAAVGKRALDWALGKGDDLRQLALVYDWCQTILSPEQSAALSAKIRQLALKRTGSLAPRDLAFAMIATADSSSHPEESILRELIEHGWRGAFTRSLADGAATLQLPDTYPLLELLHAIRDNLKIDLREDAPEWFQHLPVYLVAANYPAPYRAPENEFRIPMGGAGGADPSNAEPDLSRAALARAAGLAMVAFDNNNLENQYLQGWLIQDRFSMMTLFGAPYEFLWANPYQPGLSYYHLPLVFHDPDSGALFVRSSWDEDADWFGLYAGAAQFFHDGHVTVVNQAASGSSKPAPLQLGDAGVVFGRTPFQFSMEGGTVLAIGLKPRQKYLVETDDEEMREVSTDRAGTFILQYPAERAAGVRVHE